MAEESLALFSYSGQARTLVAAGLLPSLRTGIEIRGQVALTGSQVLITGEDILWTLLKQVGKGTVVGRYLRKGNTLKIKMKTSFLITHSGKPCNLSCLRG